MSFCMLLLLFESFKLLFFNEKFIDITNRLGNLIIIFFYILQSRFKIKVLTFSLLIDAILRTLNN